MTKRKKAQKHTEQLLKLKPSHRRFLKKPFGQLCTQKSALLSARKARFTVSVGDATTLFFLSNSFAPNVSIVDFLEKRSPTSESHREQILSAGYGETFVASNPPGTLSQGALLAVKEAISFASKSARSSSKRTAKPANALIAIVGEEDLVFLAAALHAPPGAFIFYGQPGKGIVAFECTRESKIRVERVLGEAFE